ncbi:hypothetical protein JD844_023248 [Phrynosoma platyrhinos]|uniref:BZIP domain-containing protein n=1 Tax=Phrynosoma platyrhinos TaxID=52577 RepID=A0ABQ7SWR2_PHRPL|nr:hypothetical protein JD844_023248 [Phrynosoma platyrhinos]
MTCHQTPQVCQGLKKKSLRKRQLHLPSLLSQCQLRFTKQAVGNTCGPDFLLGTGVADIYHQYGNAVHAVAITQGGAIQLANNGTDGVQGLQTLTMTNAAATQPAASGDVQTYQIRTAPTSTIAPGVVMASSPALPTQPAEEAARKREVRLMKNREAARECRRKKKEYVKCLENRVAVLENQNKTLIEELKALKDLYCHKSD